MAVQEIKAKAKSGEVVASYDFGDNLQDATKRFGDEVVFDRFVAQAKIDLQAILRRLKDAGLEASAILAQVEAWKPGVTVRGPRLSPKEAILAQFRDMSPEERKAFLQELRASAESA